MTKQLYCAECDKVYATVDDKFALMAEAEYCLKGHKMEWRDEKN